VALKVKLDTSEPGYWISGVGHVALLAGALFAYSTATFPEAEEGIPVEIITDNQFSQITKGETNAKQVQPTPKPRADRVADTAQQRDPGEDKRDAPAPPKRPADVKVAEKEDEVAAQPPPPPPPPPSRAEPKADPRREEAQKLIEKAEAEAIAQQKAAEAKAKVEAEAKAKVEVDAKAKAEAEAKKLAEAKAREEAEAKTKAEAEAKRVAEAKAKAEAEAKARKEAELAKKLDIGDLRQFLQNKERNQSTGATGAEIQKTASLGTATGSAQKLNPSQRDALMGLLREQIERCYQAPISASAGTVIAPVLDIRLNQDGTLSAEPAVLRAGASSTDRAVADAALRAVRRCAPFRVPAQFAPYYSDWKTLNVQFDLS
jgi:colicin import membrane protein